MIQKEYDNEVYYGYGFAVVDIHTFIFLRG